MRHLILALVCAAPIPAQVTGQQQMPAVTFEENFDDLSAWNLGAHAADFSRQVMRCDGRTSSSALVYTCPSPAPT